jgi:hypothetical protein
MSKALRDLTAAELDKYCAEIARAGEAARAVGGKVPAVIEHAAAEAAAEVSKRWRLK